MNITEDFNADRRIPMTATQQYVADVVADMELSFATGSRVRVTWRMLDIAPHADNIDTLTRVMKDQPMMGWSCWDMSVLLVEILRKNNIVAGITIAMGGETGAPATPHSIVRVEDVDGTFFYSDPYFGIGVAGESHRRWSANSGSASFSAASNNYGRTDILKVSHKSHTRDYLYHILPGVLSDEQLKGAIWQAPLFGNDKRYIRSISNGLVWTVIMDDSTPENSQEALCLTRTHDAFTTVLPVATTGNWEDLMDMVTGPTGETDRVNAIERVFARLS